MSLASLWLRSSSSEFKFCLSRYWWLKLKSLAEKEEWEELEKFSKSKKSPIGYLVGKSRPQLAPMILFDFFNVKNILLCIIFRPLWTSASRKITSTRPRSTFPEWRPSRRSKLTWPSGKMSAPPPNPSKWPQGSSIISAPFFFRSDLEGAADAAIERRNEAEISAVLARCSASDRLLTDRLNRAKLSTAKKWAENRRVCVCVPVISARHLDPI